MPASLTKNGLVDLDHPAPKESKEPTVRNMIEKAKCASEDCTANHPVASTMIALGAGAIVGLVIGATMIRRETQRRENYFSRIGNGFANSLGNSIPDSFNWKR